jgi:rare lipoprotein A
MMRSVGVLFVALMMLLIAGCGSTPKTDAPKQQPSSSAPAKPGGFYKDDGPHADTPANLDSIPDAIPREERFHSGANRPYTVFGRSYVPVVNQDPFRQSGIASWYGKKFHGNTTSIGEIYDMFAMTAAHPTLPLPSYVRVTNPANNRSVVVRVNDRGPFHADRIIDLSYAAAHRLGFVQQGSARVNVERVFAGDADTQRVASASAATANPTRATPTPLPSSTPTPPQVTTSPVTSDGAQLFLQLGAFSSQDNANIFRARMLRELDWNREPINVVFKDGLFRVRMGPYVSRGEAEAIQARVKDSHDFSPVIAR